MPTVIVDRVRSEAPYVGFLLGIFAFTLFVLSLTFGFQSERTATLPRLAIAIVLVTVTIDLLLTLYPDIVPSRLRDTADLDSDPGERTLKPIDVAIQVGWIVGYLLIIDVVGFFTTTFLFVVAYILVNDSEPSMARRTGVAVAWSIGISTFLYLLFVELLRVSSVFRFGVLP